MLPSGSPEPRRENRQRDYLDTRRVESTDAECNHHRIRILLRRSVGARDHPAVFADRSLRGTSLVKCREASWWQTDDVTDGSGSDAASAGFALRRSYRPGRCRRLENAVMRALVRAGLVPLLPVDHAGLPDRPGA